MGYVEGGRRPRRTRQSGEEPRIRRHQRKMPLFRQGNVKAVVNRVVELGGDRSSPRSQADSADKLGEITRKCRWDTIELRPADVSQSQ